MDIKTFEIDGNNRIIVNGVKLMWATLSDIEPYGNDETPLQEKFNMFVADKQNGVAPKKKLKPKRTEVRHSVVRRVTQESSVITKDDLSEAFRDEIEELAQFYYNKYKDIAFIEIDDIRSEILILLYDEYDPIVNSMGELSYSNKKSFIYNVKNRINIDKKMYRYIYGMTMDTKKSAELLEIYSIHKDICSSDDASYTDKEIVNYTENIFESRCNLCSAEKAKLIDLYNQIIYGEDATIEPSYEIDDDIDYNDMKRQVIEVLSTLSIRETRVLLLRFGFINGRARTLEEVGKELNVTRERVRQIEAKALRKLRHPSRSKKIHNFISE